MEEEISRLATAAAMEDEEEEEEVELELKQHVCKHCARRFRSGRSLGGHVRSHMMRLRHPRADGTRWVLGITSRGWEEQRKEQEDVEAFLASLDPNDETCPLETVYRLLREREIGCLTALLERKIPHNRLDLFPDADGCQPLIFDAAEDGFYGAVELFLRHGVPPSLRKPAPHPSLPDLLPIDAAVYESCHDQVNSGSGERLCNLMLWLPQWISENFDWWHTVKLLGRATEQGVLEMRILHYARYGLPAKLLWLLLAVPDRVLSPTFFRGTPLEQRLGSFSLRDFLTAQLAFLTGVSLTTGPNPPKGYIREDLKYKISSLTFTLRLLEVFRRAGPQLCHLMAMLEKYKEKEKTLDMDKVLQMYPYFIGYPIAQKFKTVLKEAGFPMASLLSVIRTIHPNEEWMHGYIDWIHLRDDYPGLELSIRPPHVCRSKILDSDFNRAIEKLCHHPYLQEWSPQMSVFKLLFIFCLPDLVEEMQSMLPFEPKHVNPATVIQPAYLAELCFIHITEGRIVEFTAALMAAQVLLQLGYPLRPQTSRHGNNNVDHHHDTSVSLTVHEWLLHSLMRVLDEEIRLTGKPKDDDSVQICKEKKLKISSAIRLTKIFDTSAQDIHWYLHSQRYKKVRDLKLIVNHVASLLKGTGFALRPQDICVNDLNCFLSKPGSSETELEGNSSSFGPLSQTVKSMTISTRTIEASFLAPSISNLSARSYHSFATSGYQGYYKALSLQPGNGASSVAKKVEATRQLDAISRKNLRFVAVIRRLMKWF